MESSTAFEKTGVKAPATTPTASAPPPSPKHGGWIWVILILGLGSYAVWHFRGALGIGSGKAQAASTQQARGRGGDRGVPVVVAEAKLGDLPVYLSGLGTATAFNTVTVRSRIDGQLINVAFREGQTVHQGDVLAEIDARPYQVQLEQAEGQYARDQAQLTEAKLNFDRNQQLFKQGIIAKQQLDSQQSLVDQFEGAMKTDQAQMDNAKLQISYCHITAPISGQIGLRLVDAGNMVHASDQNGLVVITQLQPIAVMFSLPQDNLPQVFKAFRAGTPLTVDAYDKDNTNKLATGSLATIDNQIDPTTGTYKLKAVFGNENGALFPNQFVNVRLFLETKRGLLIVPLAAVQRGPQGAFLYVVDSKRNASVRPVTIALTEGGSVGISDGLKPGETVVTDGQDKLQDGAKVELRTSTGGDRGGRRGGGA